MDREDISRYQSQIESSAVREPTVPNVPNETIDVHLESSAVEEPSEPILADGSVLIENAETLFDLVLLEDIVEPPDRTKENESFIIEVEEDEKAYLEAIHKQQQIAAKRYEKERKEREAWFEEFRKENGLLSSDEEEFAKAEAEENKRYTQYVEYLEKKSKEIVSQPKEERNHTINKVRSTVKQYTEEGLQRKKRGKDSVQLIRNRQQEQSKREREQKEKLKREREEFQKQLKAKEEQKRQEELVKRKKEEEERKKRLRHMQEKQEKERKKKEEKKRLWEEEKKRLDELDHGKRPQGSPPRKTVRVECGNHR